MNAKDLLVKTKISISVKTMNFLSIDCSTDLGSLFVKYKTKSFFKLLQSDKSNNDLLMKQILDFLIEINIEFDDLSGVFVNQGPGNFSGLRASLSVAAGISISKNLKLYGYNRFIWACANFFQKQDFIYSFVKLKKKYFVKKFDKNLKSSDKVEEVLKEEIIKKYTKKVKVVEKNEAKYFDKELLKLDNLAVVNLNHNDLEFLELKGLLNKELIKPLYLS